MVIQALMQFQSVMRLRPVTEHHRHGGNYLYLDAEFGVVVDSFDRIPGIGFNFAEKFSVFVNIMATIAALMNYGIKFASFLNQIAFSVSR